MATSTLGSGTVVLAGTTSGTTTVTATAVAGTTTLTLPAATDTLVGKATTDTLTNKTLTTPTISSLSSAAATALTLQSAGTTAITIDTSQKVGIGTTSPSVPLQVQAITGGLAMRFTGRASPADGYSDLSFYNNANTVSFASLGTSNSGMFFGTNTAIPLAFYTNSAEVGRFDSSGNLLVGTTSQISSGKQTISYGGGTHNGLILSDSTSTSNTQYLGFNLVATSIGSVVRVGATSAVVYNTTSDYRLKTVTGAVTGQGARLDALKPVDYLWTEGGQQARGFLAHEFQTVYPNSVSGDKDAVDANGNPKHQSMQAATSEVIADLVAEIQSLRTRITALETP